MITASAAPAREPVLLRAQGLSRRFARGPEVLHELSLEIVRGSFTCLLGASGCGKSTLLRLLAGLDAPSAGRLERAASLRCGFVFQDPTLMPWASVLDNVWLPLRLAGEPLERCRPRLMSLLAAVGLEDCAQAVPGELSGGMRMRVSIARALAGEPELLLMDEPFAALDEITRSALEQDLLAWTHARGLTVVFVTHSVSEAVFLADRIVVLRASPGRIHGERDNATDAPRDAAWRVTQDFARRCAGVSHALMEAAA